MRNFRFRLEKVSDWYAQESRKEQTRLSDRLADLSGVEQDISRLRTERSEIEHDLISSTAIVGHDLAALAFYRVGRKKQELEMNVDRERCESAVHAQRELLQFAKRRVRLLDKLKERRLSEHTREADKEIEGNASDAFLARWTRH